MLRKNGLDTGRIWRSMGASMFNQVDWLQWWNNRLFWSVSLISFSVLDSTTLRWICELFQLSSVLRFGGTTSLPANIFSSSGASSNRRKFESWRIHTTTPVHWVEDNSSISCKAVAGRLIPMIQPELGSANTDLSLLGGNHPKPLKRIWIPVSTWARHRILTAERLQDGSLKWSAVISDDAPFSTPRLGNTFWCSKRIRTPLIPAADSHLEPSKWWCRIDDLDGGQALRSVTGHRSSRDCDSQLKEQLISLSWFHTHITSVDLRRHRLFPPITGVPDMPSHPGEVEPPSEWQPFILHKRAGNSTSTENIENQEPLSLSEIRLKPRRAPGSSKGQCCQAPSSNWITAPWSLATACPVDSNLQSEQGRLKLLDNVSLIIPAVVHSKIQLQQKTWRSFFRHLTPVTNPCSRSCQVGLSAIRLK